MQNRSLILFVTIILIFTISCNDGYKERKTSSPRYIEELHTFVSFIAYTRSQEQFDRYFSTIREVCDKYSKIVSVYIDGGEANHINKYASTRPVKVSDDLLALIKKCKRYSKLTDGAFDITIKPVFDLWKFDEKILDSSFAKDKDGPLNPPDEALIKEKLKLVDYQNIQIVNDKVSFRKKGVEIILGGVAKGFILEKIRQALIDKGLKSGLLDAGGDIIIFDARPNGQKWRVGVKNPRSDNEKMHHIKENKYLVLGLELANKFIVTSGDYEQYYIDTEGKRRHHIIDPETGYPAEPVISTTVISNSIIDADILSTAIFVMGADKGIKLIDTLPETEAHIIYKDKDGNFAMRSSKGFDKYITVYYEK
jgi:FAD:protein FMN transferase